MADLSETRRGRVDQDPASRAFGFVTVNTTSEFMNFKTPERLSFDGDIFAYAARFNMDTGIETVVAYNPQHRRPETHLYYAGTDARHQRVWKPYNKEATSSEDANAFARAMETIKAPDRNARRRQQTAIRNIKNYAEKMRRLELRRKELIGS